MDENNKNFFLAIVLSMAIIFGWYQFVIGPQQEKAENKKRQQQELAKKKVDQPGTQQSPQNEPVGPSIPGSSPSISKILNRDEALAKTPRIKIKTPNLIGSIALKGARIDDLSLVKYRQTVDKNSDRVVLLSPQNTQHAFYTIQGWRAPKGTPAPNADTIWKVEGNDVLTEKTPVTLVYDNGQGLVFRRTISLDENYLFTIKQEVENKTAKAVALKPWAIVSRHEEPKTTGFFVLHEGLIGVMGDANVSSSKLIEISYSSALSDDLTKYDATGGWLGFTDKYWAAVIIPEQNEKYEARFSGSSAGSGKYFQTDYASKKSKLVEPGQKLTITSHVYAGAKQTHVINDYAEKFKIKKFELMIDWGWFWFLTKPLFYALDYFNKVFGNYGLSILFVTVLIKLLMFPLANKSYESMSKMKKLQPEMQRIKERFKDDAMRVQKEMMELYKKEKINPVLGCLPVFVQIPVFFALYKVLFITIDMRHAPFFGWISDLSAPDPTNLFNLFGLLPFDPPWPFQVGIWAILMGLTMWVQMKLNPQQADPMQQAIFNWMPVMFTFMLATFPAGLVIYWAWNNLLSVIQQRYIMVKNGVEVNLLENTGLDKLWGLYKSYTGANKT